LQLQWRVVLPARLQRVLPNDGLTHGRVTVREVLEEHFDEWVRIVVGATQPCGKMDLDQQCVNPLAHLALHRGRARSFQAAKGKHAARSI
jgi:hypothetical protein